MNGMRRPALWTDLLQYHHHRLRRPVHRIFIDRTQAKDCHIIDGGKERHAGVDIYSHGIPQFLMLLLVWLVVLQVHEGEVTKREE